MPQEKPRPLPEADRTHGVYGRLTKEGKPFLGVLPITTLEEAIRKYGHVNNYAASAEYVDTSNNLIDKPEKKPTAFINAPINLAVSNLMWEQWLNEAFLALEASKRQREVKNILAIQLLYHLIEQQNNTSNETFVGPHVLKFPESANVILEVFDPEEEAAV